MQNVKSKTDQSDLRPGDHQKQQMVVRGTKLLVPNDLSNAICYFKISNYITFYYKITV